jgi:hypothetical protein
VNCYRYTFAATCPMNGEAIIYTLELRSPERIMVEHIKTACALHKKGFHEDIAADLHARFPVELTLSANHHGVTIESRLAVRSAGTPT